MSASYYDALLPVREPSADPQGVLAGIRLPYRVLASICIPGGRIVVAFISDSVILSRMFAANWARAKPARRRNATLYALARPARGYGLDRKWDGARWWSRDRKMMMVFGFGSYRLAKVCVQIRRQLRDGEERAAEEEQRDHPKSEDHVEGLVVLRLGDGERVQRRRERQPCQHGYR